MKVDWFKVAALTLALAAFAILLPTLTFSFPLFHYATGVSPAFHPVEEAGNALCDLLWGYRQMDLLAQAILLFASTACSVALLRRREAERQ